LDFIKLNFDGASKGNPGAAGFGVVFRNHQGNILPHSQKFRTYYQQCNITLGANNMATIGHKTQLQQTYSGRIFSSHPQPLPENLEWSRPRASLALLAPLSWSKDNFISSPTHGQALIPSHVRRKSNQIADNLANIGVEGKGPDLLCQAPTHQTHPIFQRC
jgi:hypothetical protein